MHKKIHLQPSPDMFKHRINEHNHEIRVISQQRSRQLRQIINITKPDFPHFDKDLLEEGDSGRVGPGELPEFFEGWGDGCPAQIEVD